MYSNSGFIFLIIINLLSGYDCKYECKNNILITQNSEYLLVVDRGNNLKLAYNLTNTNLDISKYGDEICFKNINNEIEFILTLKKIKINCQNLSTVLYSVPILSAATCEIKESSEVWDLKKDVCSLINKSKIESYFKNENNKNVIDAGCVNEYRSYSDNNYWWIAYLEWYKNLFVDIRKCDKSDIQYIFTLESNKTGSIVKEDIILSNNLKRNIKFNHTLGFTIDVKDKSINILSKYMSDLCVITNNKNDIISVVNNCNPVSDLTMGSIGEIQCNNKGNSYKCKINPRILSIFFASNRIIGCRTNSLYYNKMINDNSLPLKTNNYIIDSTDEERLSVAIEKMDPNLVFNLKTDIIIDSKIEKDICEVRMADRIELEEKINGTANFTVKVRSHSKVILSTQCEDETITMKNKAFLGSGIFENVAVMFYPTKRKIRTKCKLFCDDSEMKEFDLVGRFEFNSIKMPIHLLNKGKDLKYHTEPEEIPDNPFSILFNSVVDFLKTTIGKIAAAITTLLITVIVVLIVLSCLGKIDFLKLICKGLKCCICKKKPAEDEGMELEEIKVISKKLLNNVYYSYDNNKISIFNDDYSIKPSGIFCHNLKIVESIPRIMFYKDNFVCKNNAIIDTNINKTIIKNLNGNWELNSSYIIVKNIVYDKEDLKEPLILVRSKRAPGMKILDTRYKNIENSLYLDNDIIIKNIFIDF